MSPAKRRRAVERIQDVLQVSERRACATVGQPRSTQRQGPVPSVEEDRLRSEIVSLACQYGRYGYRRITGMLRREGWRVNHKRVERIWRQEGLKVPRRQRKRKRLWMGDGSCIRLRPERRDHVWSYDFLSERTSDGRPLRILTVLDEYTRECLTIQVARQMKAVDVIDQLTDLFVCRGTPEHIRSDNGSEFTHPIHPTLAPPARCEDPVHRTGKSLGEWIHRILQRKIKG
jgi:putative transposase